jgi:anti-sigma regulatory factor (Ser/Thr protein kinase)
MGGRDWPQVASFWLGGERMEGTAGTARSWFAATDKQATSGYYLRWPLVSVAELDAVVEAIPAARRHVRDALKNWGTAAELTADMELICAELVENAVAATRLLPEALPVGLRLLANSQRLVIEVMDCHPGLPVRRDADAFAEHGRGLAIVAELASRWGSRRLSAHVKSVWAELLQQQRM